MPFPTLILRFGVYHWKSFEFDDGTSKNKYFIAFNCKLDDLEIAIVLPTSQVEKYTETRLIDTVLINRQESEYFPKDTIIDLKNIKTYKREKIENAINSERIRYLGILEDFLIERIKNAINSAITLSPRDKKTLLCD